MGIRKGVDEIDRKNKQVAQRSGVSSIPEVFLREDGEKLIMRLLNDDPLDVDMHEIYDQNVGGRPQYVYCTLDDIGSCEYHDQGIPLKRMFYFWTFVMTDFHPTNSDDPEDRWEAVKVGSRTLYKEEVNAVRLLKRKFGKSGYLWQQFKDVLDNFGTWKDREYAFTRKGLKNDPETTYSLTVLDKTPLPKEAVAIINKLPSLEAVAKGMVTKLEIESAPVAAPVRPAPARPTAPQPVMNAPVKHAQSPSSAQPKITMEIPEIESDNVPEE